MQFIGVSAKRKSMANLVPQLPKVNHQRMSGKRTIYKQLITPSQQLKDFKRRLIFTQTTDKSISRLGDEGLQSSRKKIEDNSVNMFERKLTFDENSLMKRYESQNNILAQFEREERNAFEKIQLEIQKEENQNNEENILKEAQNNDENNEFEGYVEGSKADEEEAEEKKNKLQPKTKTYSRRLTLMPMSQVEADKRMERKHLQKQFDNMRRRKEDIEIIGYVDKYKAKKQQKISQSAKKHEISKMVLAMKYKASLPRISSLPKLSSQTASKFQITLPSYEELTNPEDRSKTIALQRRIQSSLSIAKKYQKDKKYKLEKKNEGDQFEEEMNHIHQVGEGLRQRGIEVSTHQLKKSLLNIRNVPDCVEDNLPLSKLFSNPLLKLKKA